MKRFRWLVVVCAVVVTAAACGRSGSSATQDTTPPSSGTSSDTSSSVATTAGAFGDVGTVCEKGSPSGSPASGVTSDTIKIGTIADPGFAGRPGLDQELFDTAKVFAAWCNAAGGINGRKIENDLLDAALTNEKAKVDEACIKDFFLVGGGAVFDQDGVKDRLSCLLPEVAGYAVSPEQRGSDLLIQPIPNKTDQQPIGDYKYLAGKYPDATKAYGVITGDLSTTKLVAKQTDEIAQSLGWKKVYDDVYPAAGATDWTPVAQKIKDAGVKGLLWTGEPENLAKLMQALSDIGYQLDFVRTDANHYDQKLTETGKSAIKNVYVRSAFSPFEIADDNEATQQYLDAFDKYLPSGKKNALLGLQAWSAWLLWAKAASACDNDLTRKCVYDNALKETAWTGGGLHVPTNVAKQTPPDCVAMLLAGPNGFKLMTDTKPNNGIYHCNKADVYALKGDYGKGVTLEDVGKSQADFK